MFQFGQRLLIVYERNPSYIIFDKVNNGPTCKIVSEHLAPHSYSHSTCWLRVEIKQTHQSWLQRQQQLKTNPNKKTFDFLDLKLVQSLFKKYVKKKKEANPLNL